MCIQYLVFPTSLQILPPSPLEPTTLFGVFPALAFHVSNSSNGVALLGYTHCMSDSVVSQSSGMWDRERDVLSLKVQWDVGFAGVG